MHTVTHVLVQLNTPHNTNTSHTDAQCVYKHTGCTSSLLFESQVPNEQCWVFDYYTCTRGLTGVRCVGVQ